jgi:hypothetical protein
MDKMMGMMEKMMSGGMGMKAQGGQGTGGGAMGMKMDKMMGMMEKMMGGMGGSAPAAGAPMAGGGMMDDDQMEMGGMGGGAAPATAESKLMEKMDKLMDMMEKTMSGGAMQPAPAMPAGGMQDM